MSGPGHGDAYLESLQEITLLLKHSLLIQMKQIDIMDKQRKFMDMLIKYLKLKDPSTITMGSVDMDIIQLKRKISEILNRT